MVKAYVCRAAEWVTREAMQLHGGMGYAEEYPVSRYFVDARVLSIFEGADETLCLRVIARRLAEQALGVAQLPPSSRSSSRASAWWSSRWLMRSSESSTLSTSGLAASIALWPMRTPVRSISAIAVAQAQQGLVPGLEGQARREHELVVEGAHRGRQVVDETFVPLGRDAALAGVADGAPSAVERSVHAAVEVGGDALARLPCERDARAATGEAPRETRRRSRPRPR